MFLEKIIQTAYADRIQFTNPIKADSIEGLVTILLSAVVRIGTVVAVFMLIYSGFLFVKAQGDPGELEKAKKTFFWTVIGGVIVIGAQTISVVIQNTARGLGAGITN